VCVSAQLDFGTKQKTVSTDRIFVVVPSIVVGVVVIASASIVRVAATIGSVRVVTFSFRVCPRSFARHFDDPQIDNLFCTPKLSERLKVFSLTDNDLDDFCLCDNLPCIVFLSPNVMSKCNN
jgi:hypothetical protein